jgi:hypothetical protein
LPEATAQNCNLWKNEKEQQTRTFYPYRKIEKRLLLVAHREGYHGESMHQNRDNSLKFFLREKMNVHHSFAPKNKKL